MANTLVLGNWKMNGKLRENRQLIEAILGKLPPLSGVTIGVCPPYPYLPPVHQQIKNTGIRLGAQNLSTHPTGAMTGEVSGPMLKELGCHYVLVGHSERRTLFGESNIDIARKTATALESGLTPVICIGETEEQRLLDRTEEVLAQQLNAVISRIGAAALSRVVVAYEPVWAIGTGNSASPNQVQEAHAFIRSLLANYTADSARDIPLLYGGSVKPGNAGELFAQPDVNGGLIGGASLKAEDFVSICQSAQVKVTHRTVSGTSRYAAVMS